MPLHYGGAIPLAFAPDQLVRATDDFAVLDRTPQVESRAVVESTAAQSIQPGRDLSRGVRLSHWVPAARRGRFTAWVLSSITDVAAYAYYSLSIGLDSITSLWGTWTRPA